MSVNRVCTKLLVMASASPGQEPRRSEAFGRAVRDVGIEGKGASSVGKELGDSD